MLEDMDRKISKIEEVIEKLLHHHTVARVVIMSTKGSAPRKAHSQMIVTEKQVFGSIGGGQLEYKVTAICQQRLLTIQKFEREVRSFALGPSLGQCCGGSVRALIEYFHLSDLSKIEKLNQGEFLIHELNTNAFPYEGNQLSRLDEKKFFQERSFEKNTNLYIWGAGHTGREIMSSTKSLPLNRYWIDIAKERFPETIDPDINILWANDPTRLVKSFPSGGIHLILTHSHALDLALIQSLLKENNFYKLGLIGSLTKKARFNSQLLKIGFTSDDIDKIVCPIGLSEIEGYEPFRIAISVAGQISNWTL